MLSKIPYEQPVYSDATFPIVFHRDYMNSARRSVYTHWHAGIEVLCCYKGRGRLIHGSSSEAFGPGDLVAIDSNTIHTLHMLEGPCEYHCLIVEPSFLAAHGIDIEHARLKTVVAEPALRALYEAVVQSFDIQQAYYKPLMLAQVLLFFVQMLRTHPPEQTSAPQRNACDSKGQRIIVRAIQYILAHLSEPIRIDDISRHVGMSKFYFCRQFQAFTGTSVNQYVNAMKCDLAWRMMQENGMNVTETANYLGFQNVSYFSKLYKKHRGVSPSQDLPEGRGRGEKHASLAPQHGGPAP